MTSSRRSVRSSRQRAQSVPPWRAVRLLHFGQKTFRGGVGTSTALPLLDPNDRFRWTANMTSLRPAARIIVVKGTALQIVFTSGRKN